MSTTAEKLSLIADNERKVYDAGKTQGYTEGESAGYQNAKSEIEEVTVTPTLEAQEILPTEPNLISKVTVESGQALYDEGKQAQYDEFWDTAQQNGNRTDYQCAFAGVVWNDVTFKPKYDIKPTYGYQVFIRSRITDLKGILDKQGVVLDVSNARECYGIFSNCQWMTHIGELDFSYWNSSIQECFYYCLLLHTIDKLILGSNNSFLSTFTRCDALKNITIEGVIGNNISFSSSPLTKESITSIVNALSTTATGKTLTLKKTAVNEAFGIDVDDETTYPEGSEFYTLRHSRDNWTFSYA